MNFSPSYSYYLPNVSSVLTKSFWVYSENLNNGLTNKTPDMKSKSSVKELIPSQVYISSMLVESL